MIIEVKNKDKQQYISIKFNDNWSRTNYLKTLKSLFRVYDENLVGKNYNLQTKTLIIELNEIQTKLLKDDLKWAVFVADEVNLEYKYKDNYDVVNSIQEKNSLLKLSILK